MPEYSAGALSAGAGSTTLPIASLYGSATGQLILREISVTNTTDTSFAIKLIRVTTTGTRGSVLTTAEHDPQDARTPVGLAYNTHTVTPTFADDLGYRAQIAAAKGAGVTWVKGSKGIVIPATANAGIAILIENGTGQVAQFYFMWEE